MSDLFSERMRREAADILDQAGSLESMTWTGRIQLERAKT